MNGSTTTRRITYTMAGQAVALKVVVLGVSTNYYYLHSDHLGSTSLATTISGSPVSGSTSRYYPFGDWRTEPTAGLTDRGFTGHTHDNTGSNDLGLIYMNARYYLPNAGRFISADTLIPNPSNPQSWNRYSYVYNNPIKYIDPSGHDVVFPCLFLCGEGETIDISDWSGVGQRVAQVGCFLTSLCNVDLEQGVITGQTPEQQLATAHSSVSGLAAPLTIVSPVLSNVESQAATTVVQSAKHAVYEYIENGVTKYVGITKDFARRAGEHLSSKGWNIRLIPGLNQLTKTEARAVEQVLIEQHGLQNLENKINSIATTNPIYQDAIKTGKTILSNLGLLKE